MVPIRLQRPFTNFKTQPIDTSRKVVLGHRGSGSDENNRKIFKTLKFRENTIASLKNGLQKLDGVEFDV